MDANDPWNWEVDRVVCELCTEQRTWTPTAATKRMPNPIALEAALREQEIDGSTLLREVDEEALKNELGIKVFGQRGTIKQIIRELRRVSQEYANWKNTYGSEGNLGMHVQHTTITHSNIRKKSESPVSFGNNCDLASDLLPILDQYGANGANLVETERYQNKFSVPDRSLHGENWVAESPQSKRRKLVSLDTDEDVEISSLHDYRDVKNPYENLPLAQGDGIGTADAATAVSAPDVICPADAAELGKKRKRVAPTLITPIIDIGRDREIPTLADLVIANDPQNIEPGIIYIGEDGKKRLIPIPATGLDPELPRRHQERLRSLAPLNKQALRDNTAQDAEVSGRTLKTIKKTNVRAQPGSLSSGYLGKEKIRVDDIFYAHTHLGQELQSPYYDGSHLMEITKGAISGGRRLYVHKLMRRFLRSDPKIFCRNGKSYIASQPYATRLAPMHQAPSFTLFNTAINGEISVTRENLLHWPEVELGAPMNNFIQLDEGRCANFNLPDNLKLGGASTYDEWDPTFLEKYRYIDGGDVVLPLYGDSDEEGEYDVETWNEIEEERGTIEKPLLPVRKRQLTVKEVHAAIDEGVALIVTKWNKDKLPRRKLWVWKLWKKMEREGNRRLHIWEAKQHVLRINNERLPKMRDEISHQIWTSAKQVHTITRIMEQSIFDREDLLWQISVMKMKAEPDRPTLEALSLKPKRPVNIADGDGECIEFETEAETSYDELDDFIVDDSADDAIAEEVDQRRADDEANDTASSDVSVRLTDTEAEVSHQHKKSELMAAKLSDNYDAETADLFDKHTQSEDVKPSQIDRPMSAISSLTSIAGNEGDATSSHKHNEAASSHTATVDVIDLTLLTTDTSADEGPQKCSEIVDLSTSQKGNTNLKFTTKSKILSTGEISEAVQVLDNEDVLPLSELPPFTDPAAIALMPRELWEQTGDRDRLLIGQLHSLKPEVRADLSEIFSRLDSSQLWTEMCHVMQAMVEGISKVPGMDGETYLCLTGIMRLFEMYIDCRYRGPRSKLRLPVVKKIQAKEAIFQPFHDICRETLKLLVEGVVGPVSDDDSEPLPALRRSSMVTISSSSDDEGVRHCTPHKLRKRKVVENAYARDLREQDRQRLQEQEERRRVLQGKLAQYGSSLKTDCVRAIINGAKHDDQGFVYVHDHIKKHIKDHQIDGVRFMWDQIVANEDTRQGCLLAHTMGLGKTMQVITLLVAIAEAARSPDSSISSQIPPSLREFRTLVLCPAGLIDNWMDELLTWDPDRVLGDYRKVDSSLRSVQLRLQVINSWHKNSGVLILGYNLFRDMALNERTKMRDSSLTPEQHAQVQEQLLKGPNIIVADEAHIMKNSQAKVTLAASRFRSTSRIALTGSPLANNIEEYHTMINWVAPDYLGPIVEFRAKYVEPIQQGLYCDSTLYERRQSLKMLGVLKEDLSPKVHRADVSVLRHDLKPKTEFVITVPLTDLQMQAYSLYVRSMSGKASELTKGGQLKQTTLWHWLGILSLLCNHPICFRDKLSTSEKAANSKESSGASIMASSDDDPLAGTTPVWKVGVSEELIRQEMELFLEFGSTLDAIEHSYKVKVLLQILDYSRAAGDKVLVFSSSIPTLNYLEQLCRKTGRKYARLDGGTKMSTRQVSTKEFNTGDTELYLISTGAGGLGLNLPGANRVIIFDFRFNPVNEEQAVGRAYRIGQKKPVFVYRFVAGGTFEELIHNKAVFKMQLSSRVVDKKNPVAWATRQVGEFLFEPKVVVQQDLSSFRGKDPLVLDKILESQPGDPSIRAIVMTDTFYRHDNEVLTAEEQKEVKQLLNDEQLKRSNPKAWHILSLRRAKEIESKHAEAAIIARAQMSPAEQAILAGVPCTGPYTSLRRSLPVASVSPLLADSNESVALPAPSSVTPSSVAPCTVKGVRPHDAPSTSMPDMAPITGANTRIRSPTPIMNSHSTQSAEISCTPTPAKAKSRAERGIQTSGVEAKFQTPPPLDKQNGFKTPVRNANSSPINHIGYTSISAAREDADKLLQTAISRASRKSKSSPGVKDSIPEEVIRVVAESIRQVVENDDPTQWPSKVQIIAKHLVQDPKLVGDVLSNRISANDVVAMKFVPKSVSGGQAHFADDIFKSDNSNVGNFRHPSSSPPQQGSSSDQKKKSFFQNWFS